MKNNFLNIVPQEVISNGERTIRYKGRDGKFHDIQSGKGGDSLSVEEVTRTLNMSLTNTSTNITAVDFTMRYGGAKITAIEITEARYSSTSANKIYFDNGVQGAFPYYYNLESDKVTFVKAGNGILDEITRSTFNTDMQAAKEFFHRTIATILDQLSPYNIYYFMLKSNFINRRFELTIKENHLVSIAKDGTKTDYGIIHPTY